MTWSHANALFEFVSAVLTWVSVGKLAQEKRVQGVFAPSFLLSAVWAVVGVPYYLSHTDYWSAGPCFIRALGLVVWSCLWLHYKLKPVVSSKPGGQVRLISSRRPGR